MSEFKLIGSTVPRRDIIEKVTGTAEYVGDMNIPGQLYAAVLRSPIPHGNIIRIDCSRASSYKGVRAVVTGKDAPFYYGRFVKDQPFLAIDRVRYEGEPVAAVAADTLEIALEAVRLIDIQYEELPIVMDYEDAVRADAVLVHDDWNKYQILPGAHTKQNSNICDHSKIYKGDVTVGFDAADEIVEGEYSCAMTSHAVIEPHASIAKVDYTGKVVVWSTAQSPFYIRGELCSALGLPENMVQIIVPYIGGGFGGKLELRAEPLVIALAYKTQGKPVKLSFSRHEDFIGGVVRMPVKFKMKIGAKKDGTLTAVQGEANFDTGAYVTMGPRVSHKVSVILNGPYRVPNIKVDCYCACTNKQLGTAYRGFGVAEAAYAHELCMDALADKLKMDPLELRLKNALVEGDLGSTGEKMISMGIVDCLKSAAKGLDWYDGPLHWVTSEGKLRGKGIGCFAKTTGTPSFSAISLRLNYDGSVLISQGGTELGQGVTTVIPIFISEEIGIPLSKITMARVDTENVPMDKSTTSSRLTFHMGNAVLLAIEDIKNQLRELAGEFWNLDPLMISIENGMVFEADKPDGEHRILLNEKGLIQLIKKGTPIIGRGSFETSDVYDPQNPETGQSERFTIMWFMGANAVEVEVDPETGEIDIIQVSTGNDVGKIINRLGCVQQVEGGVMMGIGNTLYEEMIYQDGFLKNGNMLDFKVPTFMDIDYKIKVNLIEITHPEGPKGAKGLGEPAMCATQAAVAAAVNRAIGSPVTRIPLKPEYVVEACKNRIGGEV
jgi:CO/xanthine dehydrogenase Mo-binding subunit